MSLTAAMRFSPWAVTKMPRGRRESSPLVAMGFPQSVIVAVARCFAAKVVLLRIADVEQRLRSEEDRVKCDGEIMEGLEAYDLTGSLRAAGELASCDHDTVARYFAGRCKCCSPSTASCC